MKLVCKLINFSAFQSKFPIKTNSIVLYQSAKKKKQIGDDITKFGGQLTRPSLAAFVIASCNRDNESRRGNATGSNGGSPTSVILFRNILSVFFFNWFRNVCWFGCNEYLYGSDISIRVKWVNFWTQSHTLTNHKFNWICAVCSFFLFLSNQWRLHF